MIAVGDITLYMADILVRSIPESDAVVLAAAAARHGISQSEYLRRLIHDDVSKRGERPLRQLAGTATGLFPAGVLDELDKEWSD